MCEEWPSTYQMLSSSSPEGLREDFLSLGTIHDSWLWHPSLAECQEEDQALGRCTVNSKRGQPGSRWGTAGHRQRLGSRSLCSCSRGTLTLSTTDVAAAPPWWELKWVKSTLCPSTQKSRQKCKESGIVSETICILLWEPRSLIKAPTGLEIWLSFPDFIPWLDTQKGLQGWDV